MPEDADLPRILPIGTQIPLPPRARGITQFYDAVGNVIANPDAARLWGGYVEANLVKPAEASVASTVNNYNQTINANMGGVEARLDAVLAALRQQATKAEAEAQNQVRQIIQVGEREINTNAVPILGKLEAISSGALPFSVLDDATITAIYTSIPWALEFLQSERLSQGNAMLGQLARTAIQTPGAIVSGVGDALTQLGEGLLKGISDLLLRIEGLILDPLAALLAAILAELNAMPGKVADAVWDSLLKDQGAGAVT